MNLFSEGRGRREGKSIGSEDEIESKDRRSSDIWWVWYDKKLNGTTFLTSNHVIIWTFLIPIGLCKESFRLNIVLWTFGTFSNATHQSHQRYPPDTPAGHELTPGWKSILMKFSFKVGSQSIWPTVHCKYLDMMGENYTHLIPQPWALISYDNLHSSGKVFHVSLEHGCRDLLSFSNESITKVGWVISPGSSFHFITEVLDGVEVRALCRLAKFSQIKIIKEIVVPKLFPQSWRGVSTYFWQYNVHVRMCIWNANLSALPWQNVI